MGNMTPTCPYCGAGMEREHCKSKETYWYMCQNCEAESPYANTQGNALYKALHLASPWHSVKDGLPESGTICVVHGHNKHGTDCYDTALRCRRGWVLGCRHDFEVEHWMAMPDAPKEDNHADT